MGWVVKQWRLDTLERLLTEASRAELADARATADRDARRARRAANRTAVAADLELSALERLGEELRTAVRDWRVWLRDVDAGALPDHAAPPAAPAPPAVSEPPEVAAPPVVAASAAVAAPPAVATAPAVAAPPMAAEPPEVVAPPTAPAPPTRSRRPARASLHSSALTELFRATAAR